MSSLITDLAGLKSRKEDYDQRQAERDRPKANWFKINSNETLTIRFLQELSPEANNYNPSFGTFLGAVEHQAPGKTGYLSRALDTMESEGRDWAQEQHLKNPTEGWRARENFYINVAVKRGNQTQVEILSRNMHSQFIGDLVEEYELSNGEGITGKTYTITRKGSGPQTTWRLREASEQLSIDGLQPWDLKEYAVRSVSYDKQREFYMRNYTPENTQDDSNPFASDSASTDSGSGDQPSSVTSGGTFNW